jgi:N-methylhydantoinase A
MRFAVDTGGTFTDLIVEDDADALHMFKAPTTPDDPIRGVLDSLLLAARDLGMRREELLARGQLFAHGTTHAINAIVTGTTARTAFITTEGHRDILVIREGGRMEPFNFTVPYPEPYIPRSLTFEAPERILADGTVARSLDEGAIRRTLIELERLEVEAIAVCLLWSIVNPIHELRIGELIQRHLPGVPYTLSHALNPSLREYRRASSACIDASLKPRMTAYMRELDSRLRTAGFSGRLLVVTSQGGVMDAADAADAPIHLINSGPSLAPLSGHYFSLVDEGAGTAVIADTGGTTFDVSLVRKGRIPRTRDAWIGQPFRGHMTGFPSVDVKSIGAGGGSIAWVDDGGMLHVGPQSAGAVPGPVCYGRGGDRPTLTDAALTLGFLDPNYFLGGAIKLDGEAARRAIDIHIARPLRLSIEQAAAAIVNVITENMVQAIADITVNQGIDPRDAVLVGGGGAAGLNSVLIARRLGCRRVLIPEVGAALSAAGAIMSDLVFSTHATFFTTTNHFDRDGVNRVLGSLVSKCERFAAGAGPDVIDKRVEIVAEARYPHQVWEIETAIPHDRFYGPSEIAALANAFHATHQDVFAVCDPASAVEVVGWNATISCKIRRQTGASLAHRSGTGKGHGQRRAYFTPGGFADIPVLHFDSMADGERVVGPALVESAFTTVVLDPGASATRRPSGSLSIEAGQAV